MSSADRRSFLTGLTAAAALMAPAARAGVSSSRDSSDPGGLLDGLAPGRSLAFGWSLVDVAPLHQGAIVLTLGHAEHGDRRVHLCRRSGVGITHTRDLDLVLMDGSTGTEPTDEGLGRTILGLAAWIRSREKAGFAAPSHLLTHAQRLERYGDGVF